MKPQKCRNACLYAVLVAISRISNMWTSIAFTNAPMIKRCNTFVRNFHPTISLNLNRFLFDPSEIDDDDDDEATATATATPTITLPKNDYRTIHAAKILGLLNDETLRAGIIQDADIHNSTSKNAPSLIYDRSGRGSQYAGLITDEASIQWIPEGKIKKAQPTKNGDPPGSLQITLQSLKPITEEIADIKPRVSLILAMPRPLAWGGCCP